MTSGCSVILEPDGKEYYLDTIDRDQDRVNGEGLYYAGSYTYARTGLYVISRQYVIINKCETHSYLALAIISLRIHCIDSDSVRSKLS